MLAEGRDYITGDNSTESPVNSKLQKTSPNLTLVAGEQVPLDGQHQDEGKEGVPSWLWGQSHCHQGISSMNTMLASLPPLLSYGQLKTVSVCPDCSSLCLRQENQKISSCQQVAGATMR